MAESSLIFPVVIVFLLLQFPNSGTMRLANAQAPGQGSWCVPRPSASYKQLLANINYACNFVNCAPIQKGGSCFYPECLINHASVAMNLYYQKAGKHYWNCNFNNSALIVVTDPSYGRCKFDYTR